ncbi:putative permease, DMT superfamily [Archaeoglobus sulfaticallidus PM70-1]|uniref:Putative permease, DMT superfamily n=1 Tax=Archaeoglobus sulfaticallidus PM70-1 TaxID=387631 RepID=N0BI31_9EURY|nr:EamA family transporter [Archaeoglobus sulfaticallidus]AGK61952.1 putative permease, DMT superfamily [Archaeoglobus sulfaticallidus PM70-1]
MQDRKVIAIISMTVLFWGWAFLAIKVAVKEVDAYSLTFYRFTIANVFLTAYLLLKKAVPAKEDIPRIFALGFFGVTAYHVLLNFGEMYISSGLASLIIALAPVFVFFFSISFLGEDFTIKKFLGSIIALSGVFLVILDTSDLSFSMNESMVGVAAVFVSALSATFYIVYGKVLFEKYEPLTLTAYAIIFATVPLLLLIPFGVINFEFNFSAETAYSILFLGIFATFLGYTGWYYVLDKMQASQASIFLQAIPVVAVFSAWFLLGEKITLLTVLGTIFVVVGVYFVNR